MSSSIFRPRYLFFAFLIIMVPLVDILTNPDNGFITDIPFGASFFVYLILLGRAAIAVLALHWIVSYIFDTKFLDVVALAKDDPADRGLYAVAVSLFAIAFAIVIQAVISI